MTFYAYFHTLVQYDHRYLLLLLEMQMMNMGAVRIEVRADYGGLNWKIYERVN